MRFKAILIGFIFCFSIVKINLAVPLVGGEITWQCVGQDSFIISFTLYRDCDAWVPPWVNIELKNAANGNSITTLNINRSVPVNITPTCDQSCNRCDSHGCSFSYGFQKYEYNSGIVDLNSAVSVCEILIEYKICCRPNVTTIASLTSKYYYNDAMFNRCLSPCDNSPVFSSSPLMIVCKGSDCLYSFNAYDLDLNAEGKLADSLVYELMNPKGYNGNPISYNYPYSKDKPLYYWGFPNTSFSLPRGFHFNSTTGDMKFRPMKLESTVLAIKVKEYRNRQLIGYISRDVRLYIIDCQQNKNPELSGPFYKGVCSGRNVSFMISSSDNNPGDSLEISWNQSIPGAFWHDSNGLLQHPSGYLDWTPGYNTSGLFYFNVTVKDDHCPLRGVASQTYSIEVKKSPTAFYQSKPVSTCNTYLFQIDSIKGEGISQVIWSGAGGLSANGDSLTHQYPKPGIYPFTLTCTSVYGCRRTYYDTIITDTFLWSDLPSDTQICYGDSILLSPQIYDQKGQVSYQWSSAQQSAQIIAGPIISDTIIYLTIC